MFLPRIALFSLLAMCLEMSTVWGEDKASSEIAERSEALKRGIDWKAAREFWAFRKPQPQSLPMVKAGAALITDLKRRGLLEDTLVILGGEFGRTPYTQLQKEDVAAGRDHHSTAFSMLLAGGGVKGGMVYGSSDELGMLVEENPVHVHDFHATILHLLGINHEELTYRYAGRDFRLTDVHGRVVHDIMV